MPGHQKQADQWSAEDKLAIVIETAGLSEAELSAYCREKWLFTEQVKQWRTDCLQGFGRTADSERQVKQERKKTTKEIKKLKAEVRRKDKALAETSALLVLSKKLEALYGDEPDNEDD